MRLGHFRPVHVKSAAAQHMRATLVARKQLVNQVVMIECTIRGILKVQGLKVGAVHRCTFAKRVEELLEDAPETRLAIEPLLVVRNLMREENRLLGYRLERLAKKDAVCRLFMTIPGVGPLTSLAYKATIDDPMPDSDSNPLPYTLIHELSEIQWCEPWWCVCLDEPGRAQDLEEELRKELCDTHVLYPHRLSVRAIAKREDRDDALFWLPHADQLLAIVHLTWKGDREMDARWPTTSLLNSLTDFVEWEMIPAYREWSNS